MASEESVSLSTGLFTLGLKGSNALFIFLLLLLITNIGVTIWENYRRELEHQQIMCSTKLSIFIYQLPRGTIVDWDRMPVDLFPCVPRFMFDRPRGRGDAAP